MAEKTIIFSTGMVKAILSGEKTQTRRVIKPQPQMRSGSDYVDGVWFEEDKYGDSHPIRSPYGRVGDLLWVREAAYISPAWFCAIGDRTHADSDGAPRMVGYAATMSADAVRAAGEYNIRKTPSIHMPRWASRITLLIKHVRAEQLQDISEDDAAAEGIERHSGPYILDFARLWDSINAKRGYSWASNPWVWVVEFEVAECPNSLA